jgi:HTH-type transcriptional regulator, sugar sensing transcriptional regulator
MYEEILKEAGLSKEQTTIYTCLLENGPMQARKIVSKTGIKRGLVYKALSQLININLVEKVDKQGSVTVFHPKHPNKIMEMVEERKRALQTVSESMRSVVGQMTSDFNLISGKPNVQFFEGMEGSIKAGTDSLYSKTEILEYIDNQKVLERIPEFNEQYVKERKKDKIKKRMLVVDTSQNRERAIKIRAEETEIRFIDSSPFSTVMQIYDNKISYVTLNKEKMIGVIIECPEIYGMHKTIFESQWEKARKLIL